MQRERSIALDIPYVDRYGRQATYEVAPRPQHAKLDSASTSESGSPRSRLIDPSRSSVLVSSLVPKQALSEFHSKILGPLPRLPHELCVAPSQTRDVVILERLSVPSADARLLDEKITNLQRRCFGQGSNRRRTVPMHEVLAELSLRLHLMDSGVVRELTERLRSRRATGAKCDTDAINWEHFTKVQQLVDSLEGRLERLPQFATRLHSLQPLHETLSILLTNAANADCLAQQCESIFASSEQQVGEMKQMMVENREALDETLHAFELRLAAGQKGVETAT